jgi:thiamine kinase
VVQELSPARARQLIPPQALAQVPGYSPAARIAALAGGAVNETFRVETADGRFIVRLHDALGIELGADHIREAQLQNAAAAAGVAPTVLHVDSQQRFMISEYIEGRLWSPADFADAERLRRLGGTLRRLHEVIPPVNAPFDLQAHLRALSHRLMRRDPAGRPLLTQLMERAETSLRACGTSGRAPSLFHSDLQHSNIIEAGDKLFLLDWEYAAVGDPLFDLACVLAYYPHALPHASNLLDAAGLGGSADLPMLEHATWLYVLLSFFWERARLLGKQPGAGIRLPTPSN